MGREKYPLVIEFHRLQPARLSNRCEKQMIQFTVNGKRVAAEEAEPDTPLLWFLRDHLGLTGTKYGCGISQCGACTVLIDGNPARSCVIPITGISGAEITTIEGLSGEGGHPLQVAWSEENVPPMRLLSVRTDYGGGGPP